MPRLAQMTDEELQATARSAVTVANELGVTWIRSYVSADEGKIYCEYEAPNPEAILEHARRAGLPVDKISEVTMEIAPEMFV